METMENYKTLESVYDAFNAELFNSTLPECIITLTRKKCAAGYFHADSWIDATETTKHEISLNPELFLQRDLKQTLSTLVHEMCHLQQAAFGKPSRSGYHNKEWAEMMLKVGLQASNTGLSGGKTTGQKMTHYIIENGAYSNVFDALDTVSLDLSAITKTTGKAKRASKTKFTCPACNANAWGKESLLISCADCAEMMVIV